MSRFVGFRDKIWDNFKNFFKLRVLSFYPKGHGEPPLEPR